MGIRVYNNTLRIIPWRNRVSLLVITYKEMISTNRWCRQVMQLSVVICQHKISYILAIALLMTSMPSVAKQSTYLGIDLTHKWLAIFQGSNQVNQLFLNLATRSQNHQRWGKALPKQEYTNSHLSRKIGERRKH